MTRILMSRTSIVSIAAALCSSVAAGPPAIEMVRSTIDGGGLMFSAGGDFELSGTIGQPDAGVLVGGDFELTGGFWVGLPPTDCNDDGIADLFDHRDLTACLSGPGLDVDAGCECFDVDDSGAVDLRDFAVAQSAY